MRHPSTRLRPCPAVDGRRAFALVVLHLGLASLVAGGQGLVEPDPQAVRMSPAGESYVDPEVLQVAARLVFQTGGGDIWVAELDPSTGLFRSSDGKDSLVDAGAYPVAVTWGGPEFGLDASGWSLYYSKATMPGGPPQTWRAEPSDVGWVVGPLTDGEPHQTQLATTSLTRTGTRVLNIRGSWSSGTIAWFCADDPATEHQVVEIDDATFGRTPTRSAACPMPRPLPATTAGGRRSPWSPGTACATPRSSAGRRRRAWPPGWAVTRA